MAAAIEAAGLSVKVHLPDFATWSLKEFVVHGLRRRISQHEIWPLRDVTVSIEPGELMGVIGRNGAGKTTLMRAVSGIIRPTEGRVRVRGRVTPVLGLGAGLNTDLTGRENIELLGALLGQDPRELRRRAGAIAEWAELTDYLDVPLRMYSAGMSARLALAIVTDHRPDVLLLDEIFAVGDAEFQLRSRERILDLLHSGSTVMLVSHDLATIEEWSSRVMWLDAGRMVAIGDPTAVVAQYGEAAAHAA
ncbi:MAG: type transport system ATP-binding protein [Thermoleophilaceae bacterium]|nr:type transport system ATP-binding protein [Thermoleophilaceae bacterium]